MLCTFMYSVSNYVAMIHDARRVGSYQQALQLTVTPDSVVVDIGTGLGIFAFLACKAGARKVYAIEPAEVIAVAQALAEANGYRDRIEFIEAVSTLVTLPEQADVVVSDMSGALPLFQQHLPSIVDARKRLLKPFGKLIPMCDALWAGVVSAPEVHAKIAPSIDRVLGLDMGLAWKMAANLSFNKRFHEADLMTAPQRLAVLNYYEVTDPNLHAKVTFEVTRPGIAHGISLWFDRTLADGVGFSTSPTEPEMVYGGLFLPWPQPAELDGKYTVHLDVRADLLTEGYNWTWNTTVSNADKVQYTFRQSDFLGAPHSTEKLRKRSASHMPRLNDEGQSERMILQLMDGTNAIEDIAREVQQTFPARFPTLNRAIGYIGEVSGKYSR